MEVDSRAEVSSFEHLEELARYVDLEFILSNTASPVRFFSLDDLTDSLRVIAPSPQPSLSSSADSELVGDSEDHLKPAFLEVLQVRLVVETEPFISAQHMKDILDAALEMPSTSQKSTVSHPLSQLVMELHSIPNGQVIEARADAVSQAPSFKHLDELEEFVDLDFILSNTSGFDVTSDGSFSPGRLFTGEDLRKSVVIPSNQERFVQPPAFRPSPTPSPTGFQHLAPTPCLPGTSNTFLPPCRYQLQNNYANMRFHPQQPMFNGPPPQYYLHPERTMPATPPPSYPENMDASNVESKKKKMKTKHLQEKEDRKLVGPRFICSFPGCRKVYVKRAHYVNHLRIHPVDENHSGSRWAGYGQQIPRSTEAPGRHQQYPGTF